MANEFKIKKGLIVNGNVSGSTVLDVQGTQGQLFSITDNLSGSLFSVNDISGIPILNVNSNGTTTQYGDLIVDGTLQITETTQGTTETNILLVDSNGNVVQRSDISLTGPKGDTGDTGLAGPKGDPGEDASASYAVNVISTNTNAITGQAYVFTSNVTLTLPSTPLSGDWVEISNLSGTPSPIIARNGKKIVGIDENLTIDKAYVGFRLIFTGDTLGWTIIGQ